MTPDRWTRVADLFDRAADLAPADRPAFLDAHAVGPDGETDGALREEVERLLAFDDVPAGLLDGAPPAPPEAAPPEAGPWRLAERVGRGGMGEVWRADRPIGDDGLRQTAAVKLVRPGLGDDVAVRFRAERRILAGLDHPAIARLLGGGTASDGRPFLATEFVDGEPITAYADRRRLGVNERLALFVEVCEAVAYAHARLVVHRDLKPSNVLVADDGRVKLLDFGIAKLLDDDGGLRTRTGRPVLTPAYAAPEQAAGGPVTTATDVYGLGVLLYELLVGARPAPGGDATRPSDAVTTAGETGGRVPPHPAPPDDGGGEGGAAGGGAVPDTGALRSTTAERLRRRLRGDLDRICLKALRADPARRYRGAAELGADVQRHLDGLPVEARPESRAYRVGKFVRRNRAAVAAAAVALLAVVGGAGAALWQAAEARAEADRAETVSGFLTGLFSEADPDEAQGDTLTVFDLLALGVERSDALETEPEVRAEMLRTIGRSLASLGDPVQGDSLLRVAEGLLRSSGASHDRLAQVLDDRSAAAYGLGRFEEAEALAKRGLSLSRDRSDRRASLLISLGIALQKQGEYADAETALTDALALDMGPFQEAGALVQLATVLGETGDHEGARRALERAIPLFSETIGPNHPKTVRTGSHLATVLRLEGRPGDAEPIYRRAYADLLEVYGEDHLQTIAVAFSLGSTLNELGRYDESTPLLADALDRADRVISPAHPLTSSVVYALARAREGNGQLRDAERLLRRSVALDEAALGEDHPFLAQTLQALAEVLRKRGTLREAERAARRALTIQEAALAPDHPNAISTRGTLGYILLDDGRYSEAERFLLRAFEDARTTDSAGADQAQERLASLYEAWGRPADAERYRTNG